MERDPEGRVKILVVDDDPNIARLVELYLKKEGWEVAVVHDGDTALDVFSKDSFSLVLLDVMLPGTGGMDVLSRIRMFNRRTPVVMMTARDAVGEKVGALEGGADDYITKPFDMREMVARVRAVLRRTRGQREIRDVTVGKLTVDLEHFIAIDHGAEVRMPPKELELLFFLATHPGRAFSREEILENVWGYESNGMGGRTVDVHVKRLREKFPKKDNGWEITTVWAVGYRFEVTE